jgi:hypothetical protein
MLTSLVNGHFLSMYCPVIASWGVLKPGTHIQVSESLNRDERRVARARLAFTAGAAVWALTESNLFVVSNAARSLLGKELLGGKEHALLLLESLLSL